MNLLRTLVQQVMPTAEQERKCSHVHMINEVRPNSRGCEECLASGDQWVHLRMCKTCGHVGCCDDSKNKHARKHYEAAGHPIIRSLERDEDWMWCFADKVVVEV
jgi:monovalent cation:H+ antiporter-2, CPA2 family